jgi:transcriptional regulator with XRE-family HTH domain
MFDGMAETIHDRIRLLLKETGKKQKELAAHVGVTPQAVNQWLNTNPNKKPKGPEREHVPLIAAFFDTTESYLLSGDSEMLSHKSTIIGIDTDQGANVPFLPLDDLLTVFSDFKSIVSKSRGSKVRTQHQVSSKAVAFALQDDSMAPRFSEEDIIVIDPEVSFGPGDYIAAHIKSLGINVFRQFVYEGADHRVLKAVNSHHRTFRFTHQEWDDDVVVLGPWVERREINQKSLKKHPS